MIIIIKMSFLFLKHTRIILWMNLISFISLFFFSKWQNFLAGLMNVPFEVSTFFFFFGSIAIVAFWSIEIWAQTVVCQRLQSKNHYVLDSGSSRQSTRQTPLSLYVSHVAWPTHSRHSSAQVPHLHTVDYLHVCRMNTNLVSELE